MPTPNAHPMQAEYIVHYVRLTFTVETSGASD